MLPLITFSLRIFGIALPWARIPKDNQRTLFLGNSQEQQGSRTNFRCCLDSFNDCYWIKIMPLILRLSADIVTQKWRTTRGVLHTQFDHSHFLGQKCDNIHLFILRSKDLDWNRNANSYKGDICKARNMRVSPTCFQGCYKIFWKHMQGASLHEIDCAVPERTAIICSPMYLSIAVTTHD